MATLGDVFREKIAEEYAALIDFILDQTVPGKESSIARERLVRYIIAARRMYKTKTGKEAKINDLPVWKIASALEKASSFEELKELLKLMKKLGVSMNMIYPEFISGLKWKKVFEIPCKPAKAGEKKEEPALADGVIKAMADEISFLKMEVERLRLIIERRDQQVEDLLEAAQFHTHGPDGAPIMVRTVREFLSET